MCTKTFLKNSDPEHHRPREEHHDRLPGPHRRRLALCQQGREIAMCEWFFLKKASSFLTVLLLFSLFPEPIEEELPRVGNSKVSSSNTKTKNEEEI